ncbi:MAG TPA: tetratricopeptide repeat protein [Acidimicrobiales bacterium]|nr:tetratricopeptide repeat protein [Acidimicrobiales bacterium]
MSSAGSLSDVHGNPVAGPAEGVERYDTAVDLLVRFRPEVVPAMVALTREVPDFALGHVLSGYLSLTSTDAPDVAHARRALVRLDGLAPALDERAAAHRAALAAWAAGDWHGAARRLDDLLVRWPGDLLALLVGHQLDFFLGDAGNLRDRVGRSLHAIDPAHPHHAIVRGMYAFGLEESGHYDQARAHGLAALDRNPDDVWAIHAVVHTYEMEGRVDDGLRFLRQREDQWGDGNLFVVHNRWHHALYQLEAGQPEAALATYDGHVHNAASPGVPLEMLDASALLWRLLLDGADTGGRFGPLADAWSTRVGDEPWYVFNDLHAVMAFAGAARFDDARAVIARLEAYVAAADADADADAGGPAGRGRGARSNVAMTADVGLPACRAILAYAEGRDADVLDELLPVRTILHRFGGSHAQRDAVQRTIVDAALRSGRHDLASALLGERLARRESSVYSLLRWAEVLQAQGDVAGAAQAAAEAVGHRARFAAATAAA